MKKLHSFQVEYQVGDETVTKNIVLAKPSPRQMEEGQMEYAAQVSHLVRKGIMTRAMIYKKYQDIGSGTLPESLELDIVDAKVKFSQLNTDLQRLEAKKRTTAEDKLKIATLQRDIVELQNELVETEIARNSIYDQSADNLANNQMIFWWIFEITHIQNEDQAEPVKMFKGRDLEAKKDAFYKWEEEEPEFYKAAASRIIAFVSLLYYQKSVSEEDFKKHEEEFFKPMFEPAPKEEEVKSEEG